MVIRSTIFAAQAAAVVMLTLQLLAVPRKLVAQDFLVAQDLVAQNFVAQDFVAQEEAIVEAQAKDEQAEGQEAAVALEAPIFVEQAILIPALAVEPVQIIQPTDADALRDAIRDTIEDAVLAAAHGQQTSLAAAAAQAPISDSLAKTVLIPRGAEWRYWDAGEEPPENWNALDNSNTDDWGAGKAPLGYGQAGMNTTISFGGDAKNKRAAAFFRHEFQADPAVAGRAILCQMMNDDGAIVYLNGQEVFRRNLPAGPVTMETWALVSTKPESTYWTFVIPAGQLRAGRNVLAVRVHQRSADSSDLMHDLEAVACTSAIAEIATEVQQRELQVFTGFETAGPEVIGRGATWRYRYGDGLPKDWFQRDFDDSGWATGAAPLGMGETELKTDLSKDKGTAHAVAYFRHEFELAEQQSKQPLIGQFRFDDGAAMYINGTELLRYYLPDGELDDTTSATQKIVQENYYWTFVLLPEQLRAGKNVIALSVHQQEGSEDLIADLTLREADEQAFQVAQGIQANEKGGNQGDSYLANPNPTLIARGSVWKYWDRAESPDKQWKSPEFDDGEWAEGKAPLGYGDSFIETEISYGGDANKKHPAAYFRHKFQASDAARMVGAIGRVLHDDTVMVFLNGQEVYRRNVDENAVADGVYGAKSAISGNDETHYWTFLIDRGQLRAGDNVLAVRVQQSNANSSDLSMDLELLLQPARQFVTDARLRDNEAIGKVAYLRQNNLVNAVVADQVDVGFSVSMIHLSDGEVTYHLQDGQRHTVRMDAVVQARQYQPSAKFARALEGDTLAKIAAREHRDFEKLRLLNRLDGDKTFQHREIYLSSWSYQATAKDTIAELARRLGVKAEDLARLNDLKPDAKLAKGQELQVPGNYNHQINEYNSYFMLGRIQNPGVSSTPYEQRSVKSKIHQIKKGEDLAAIAKKYNVTEEFLRNINELEADEEYSGDHILIEYSVQPLKTSTLADIALAFNVPVENLLKANGYASEDDFDATQRVQIPYGRQMGLRNQRVNGDGLAVYEVALGNKEFKKIDDKYAVPDNSLIKPAKSLFDKLKSAVQGVANQADQ